MIFGLRYDKARFCICKIQTGYDCLDTNRLGAYIFGEATHTGDGTSPCEPARKVVKIQMPASIESGPKGPGPGSIPGKGIAIRYVLSTAEYLASTFCGSLFDILLSIAASMLNGSANEH